MISELILLITLLNKPELYFYTQLNSLKYCKSYNSILVICYYIVCR